MNTKSIPSLYQKYSLKPDTELVSLQLNMDDNDKPRSIRFPAELWAAIDADAKLNKRSSVKHLEFLLSMYYGDEMPEIKKYLFAKMKGNVVETHLIDTPLSDDGTVGRRQKSEKINESNRRQRK